MLTKNKLLHADLHCFWHGRAGTKKPSIPRLITEVMKVPPATIETDFDTDEASGNGRRKSVIFALLKVAIFARLQYPQKSTLGRVAITSQSS
jgi:hypothetical protein